MADIKITDLTAAQNVTANDLFEIAQPDNQNEYTSLKATLAQLAIFTASTGTYSALNTTAKTLIGAINESVNVQTGSLTTNTEGVAFDESFCKQCGKTVNVRVWISGLSTTTQTHTNVIYVHSVDLPTSPVRFVFTCWLGNGIAAYAGYGVMDTSGRISLVKGVANSDKASFEFTYIV